MIDIISSVSSDHSCILLKLRPTYEDNQGCSYWKFRGSLTEDEQFVNSLNDGIPLFEKEALSFTDPIIKWEFLKFGEFLSNFSIQKSKERKACRCA